MAIVAECQDQPSPADGTAFSGCTTVVWVDEVAFSVPNWTWDDYSQVIGAIWLMFVAFWVIRAVRKHT